MKNLQKLPDIATLNRTIKIIGKVLVVILALFMIMKASYRVGYIEGKNSVNLDEKLLACEQEIDSTQDRCIDMIEEEVEKAKQEILSQF